MKPLLLALGLLLSTALSWAQTYQVPIHVQPSAGGVSTSASHRVYGSLGQSVVSASANTTFRVASGFWPQVSRVVMSDAEGRVILQPNIFWLGQNYPNPFNPSTVIPLSLDCPGPARLVIFNLLGQEVRQFDLSLYKPGIQSLVWDGRDSRGLIVPSGMFFYQLRGSRLSAVQRMIYLR